MNPSFKKAPSTFSSEGNSEEMNKERFGRKGGRLEGGKASMPRVCVCVCVCARARVCMRVCVHSIF